MGTLEHETPVDIDIVRDRDITVTFEDGAVAVYPVAALRSVCPCAECRGRRERGTDPWPAGAHRGITIRDAELNGAWGLSIVWSDGHATGIYAWSVLRLWWDAGLAGGLVEDPPR